MALIISVALLAVAARTRSSGTAYAVWTRWGSRDGTAGVWLFGEPAPATRLFCIGSIIAGVVGLRLVSASVPS